MLNSKNWHTRPCQPSPWMSRKLQISMFSVHYNCIYFLLLIFFFDYLSVTTSQMNTVNIGLLLDNNTRIGKEMTTAVKVAGHLSKHPKAFLHFQNLGESPLKAFYAAKVLIEEKNAISIMGMTTWEETALVASIGNQAKVPIISFAGSAIEKPFIQQWPFLIQMVPDIKQEIKCITEIICSFRWRKVIVIYEVDLHGNDSGAFAQLSDALRVVGVEIEHHLVLPPYSSLSNPSKFVHDEVANLLSKQSQVFVVLMSSLTLGVHLFRKAKELRLVEEDSAWIISDPLAGLLDSVNTSVISSMEGALGVTTYFSESRISFLKFKRKFQQIFRLDYPEEDNSEPSIYALRAFDTIIAMKRALKNVNTSTSTSTVLMKTLLSTNFTGLSGLINFQGGELVLPSALKIVNVVGKKYKEIGVWSSKHGFSRSVDPEERKHELEEKNLDSPFNLVTWPGNLKRIPKAWSMPSEAKKMRIAVPGRSSFDKFVKVTKLSSNRLQYSGFCIEVFNEVLQILKDQYPLPNEYSPFYGSYDELVQCVANKTFDAAVGDVTILADRLEYVEFTQPFTESWLTMVVPVESQAQNQAWIFVKPFTGEMWAITGAILLYTVLIVWLLEREINPEFEGRWWNQLNTALWFTCSSLFFVHRERIYNNYTRIVVVVWLFVVLALTSSYTASLSSLLTVPRLVPSVTDIQWLKDNNAKIGCDGDSFVRKYLEDVLHFRPENIKNINSQKDYPKEFESGNIAAAFLELPYEKAFLSHYCKGYTVVGNTSGAAGDRFGGFGFVFQKGSPIVDDVSRAILSLSENGRLKQLELKYFSPSPGCSETSDAVDSLKWRSFWGLYLFSAGTSTVCGVVYYLHRFYGWLWLR